MNEIEPIGEDEFATDDIVTLKSVNGEKIDFVEIAGIAHEGEFYAILQPVELIEGMAEDEALVFKVSKAENGEDKFELVLEDEIIKAVFAKYYELLENLDGDGK